MLGVVALNLGGPDSLEAVEPYLRNLFSDVDVVQLGWMRLFQPLVARSLAKRRAAEARKAYEAIGGRSPIREETTAQAAALAAALSAGGIPARPYVAMSCWHPFPEETIARMRSDEVTRAVAVPMFPHYSRATTGSAVRRLSRVSAGSGVDVAVVERYPDEPGYIEAVAARIIEAAAAVPPSLRDEAPVLFSAHGLPESYIRKGDPYLDEVRTTVEAVARRLRLGARAHLAFQSRVGPQRWLGPSTEETLDHLAEAGHKAVVVCPIAFTGEHLETLQEIDLVYQRRAAALGIDHFARARTVGLHPRFIEALARLAADVARRKGWS